MTRVVRVFLGSSIELRGDRVALGAFVNSLNEACWEHDLYIDLAVWERESTAVAYGLAGKQAEYDELVRSSDIALFCFHTRCGAYTLEEVDAACAERGRTGVRPRIAIWGRNNVAPEPELERFYARVDAGEFGVRRRGYRDIREVELWLIEAIRSLGIALPIRVQHDFCYVGSEAVIDLDGLESSWMG